MGEMSMQECIEQQLTILDAAAQKSSAVTLQGWYDDGADIKTLTATAHIATEIANIAYAWGYITALADEADQTPMEYLEAQGLSLDDTPRCARSMGCLCAGHARGNPGSEPCDTSEVKIDLGRWRELRLDIDIDTIRDLINRLASESHAERDRIIRELTPIVNSTPKPNKPKAKPTKRKR